MIFSAEILIVSKKILRFRLSDVSDFLKMKIIIKESLKSMKRFLNRDALSFVDDLNEISSINDEEFNSKSKILKNK